MNVRKCLQCHYSTHLLSAPSPSRIGTVSAVWRQRHKTNVFQHNFETFQRFRIANVLYYSSSIWILLFWHISVKPCVYPENSEETRGSIYEHGIWYISDTSLGFQLPTSFVTSAPCVCEVLLRKFAVFYDVVLICISLRPITIIINSLHDLSDKTSLTTFSEWHTHTIMYIYICGMFTSFQFNSTPIKNNLILQPVFYSAFVPSDLIGQCPIFYTSLCPPHLLVYLFPRALKTIFITMWV